MLLNELNLAPGSSKRWNQSLGKYVIRFNRLADHIVTHFGLPGNRVVVGPDAKGKNVFLSPVFQPLPLGIDNPDEKSPILETLGPDQVPPVRLTLELGPPAAVGTARAVFSTGFPGEQPVRRPPPKLDEKTVIELPPRDYSLRVTAQGFHDPANSRPITEADLYHHPAVNISLKQGAEPNVFNPEAFGRGLSKSLSVVSTDPLAVVEVADTSGTPSRDDQGGPHSGIARGKLTLPSLRSGLYRAGCGLATIGSWSRNCRSSRGEERDVTLSSRGTPRQALVQEMARFLGVAEQAVRSSAPLSASRYSPDVYLAQAVQATSRGGELPSQLEAIGLRRLPETESFRFIFGAEPGPGNAFDALKEARLSLRRLTSRNAEPLRPMSSRFPGVAVYTVQTGPVAYRLEVEGNGVRDEIALTLLKGHHCEVIFYQDRSAAQSESRSSLRRRLPSCTPQSPSTTSIRSSGWPRSVSLAR